MLYYILALILFMLSMIFFIKSINARIKKKALSIKNIYTGFMQMHLLNKRLLVFRGDQIVQDIVFYNIMYYKVSGTSMSFGGR